MRKLSESRAAQLKALLRAGRPGVELARLFDVSKSTVSLIRLGRRWSGH
jgi:hypothetical protein